MTSNNGHVSQAEIAGDLWRALCWSAPDGIRGRAPRALSCCIHSSNLELIVAVLCKTRDLVGQIVDHAVTALGPASAQHFLLNVVAEDGGASIMPGPCPLNSDGVGSGCKVSWLSRSTGRIKRMFGCDWLFSLCRIGNTILVFSIDLEVVLFANNQVPHPCVASGDIAADL